MSVLKKPVPFTAPSSACAAVMPMMSEAPWRPKRTAPQVTGRNILPGRAILRSGLAKAADVKAGDVVTIVAESDSVKLTTRGIAKKDGAIGEVIQVINVRSNKKLYAKVVDSGTVQVAF